MFRTLFARSTSLTSDFFSLDVRALAVLRIALSLILLYDLCLRLSTALTDYTHGIFPLDSWSHYYLYRYEWSIHILSSAPWYIYSLLILQFVLALLLLAGYRTRITGFLTWALLISLHVANPLMGQGADVWLRVTLFVLLFLPMGARWSYDAYAHRYEHIPDRICTPWTAALYIQIACFYFFASQLKNGIEWHQGLAVYYTLSSYYYTKLLGFFLLDHTQLMRAITYGIVILQTITPLLLFAPIAHKYMRAIAVSLLTLMHIGLGLSIRVGYFTVVSLSVLCVFIPSFVLAYIERKVVPTSYRGGNAHAHRFAHQRYISALAYVYIVFVILSQAASSPRLSPYVHFPAQLTSVAQFMSIGQYWDIFTQNLAWRGWHIIAGERADGKIIDLLKDGAVMNFQRPEKVADLYYNAHWRRYLNELVYDYNQPYREPGMQYVCKIWNETHHGVQDIKAITLIYMSEHIPLPGRPAENPEAIILYSDTCEHGETRR